jgi:hypothetical protein
VHAGEGEVVGERGVVGDGHGSATLPGDGFTGLVEPATEDDKLERVATFVFGHVKSGDMMGAKLIVQIVAEETRRQAPERWVY